MDLRAIQWHPGRGWDQPLSASDDPDTLVMVYGGSGLLDHPEPLRHLVAAFPRAQVIGCSTAGEILGDMVFDDTVTAMVTRFDSTRTVAVQREVTDPGRSRQVGVELGRELSGRLPELQVLFVLADGLGVNGSALVAGLVEGTEGRVVITGGLAGDGERFARTWVLAGGEPRQNHVVAVGFAGPSLVVGHGSGGGWEAFGPARHVTRSQGNVLYELDGEPALELYKHYLGDRAAGLPATALLFPLAIRAPEADDRELVRTILGVDDQAQSMTFAGDVPIGSIARLMRGTVDGLVGAAGSAAEAATAGLTRPTLVIAVSCIGRRLTLGRRVEDELEAALSRLPAGSELVGFYSYGEISPVAAGSCDLHNQTMTITTITEAG